MDEGIDMTPILRKSKEAARIVRPRLSRSVRRREVLPSLPHIRPLPRSFGTPGRAGHNNNNHISGRYTGLCSSCLGLMNRFIESVTYWTITYVLRVAKASLNGSDTVVFSINQNLHAEYCMRASPASPANSYYMTFVHMYIGSASKKTWRWQVSDRSPSSSLLELSCPKETSPFFLLELYKIKVHRFGRAGWLA